MSFYMRNYTSEEKYDISKFMNYVEGTYDVLDSIFLEQIVQLPTVRYYYVDKGYKEIDLISTSMYNNPFLAYLIQYYNGDFRETFPEGTVLKLFALEDLEELYYNISMKSNLKEE